MLQFQPMFFANLDSCDAMHEPLNKLVDLFIQYRHLHGSSPVIRTISDHPWDFHSVESQEVSPPALAVFHSKDLSETQIDARLDELKTLATSIFDGPGYEVSQDQWNEYLKKGQFITV